MMMEWTKSKFPKHLSICTRSQNLKKKPDLTHLETQFWQFLLFRILWMHGDLLYDFKLFVKSLNKDIVIFHYLFKDEYLGLRLSKFICNTILTVLMKLLNVLNIYFLARHNEEQHFLSYFFCIISSLSKDIFVYLLKFFSFFFFAFVLCFVHSFTCEKMGTEAWKMKCEEENKNGKKWPSLDFK